MGIAVLSLFDGISVGRLALEEVGIEVDGYYASEIEVPSIKVSQYHFPNTIQLGDVTKVKYENGILYSENGEFNVGKIDLVIGGSPCQGFSFGGKQLNFDDPRSKLFFEYERLLREIKPKYFFLENVKMQKKFEDIITDYLKVKPILINSALVSAQNRKRLYWTNIPWINQPENKDITLRSIIDNEGDYKYVEEFKLNNRELKKNYMQYDINMKGHGSQDQRAYYLNGKSGTLNTSCGGHIKFLLDDGRVRYATTLELERLQTLPDGYTSIISRTQAAIAIGNGWTLEIIKHLIKGLKEVNNI